MPDAPYDPRLYPAGNVYVRPQDYFHSDTPVPPSAPSFVRGTGQVSYTQDLSAAPLVIEARSSTPVLLPLTSATVQDNLGAPFAGVALWDGSTVRPRALNDIMDVQLNLLCCGGVVDGRLLLEGDVGSSLGPIAVDAFSLFHPAGTQERASLRIHSMVGANFLQNGLSLILTSTVPLTITRQSVIIIPGAAG